MVPNGTYESSEPPGYMASDAPTVHLIFRLCGLYDIFGSPESSKTSSVGLCEFPDPLGSLGLRLYGPYGIHGLSRMALQ